MKMRSVAPMRIAKIGYIVMSVAFCAVGIFLIVNPGVSAWILGDALGVVMVVFGIIKIIGYFSKDLFRLAFQYDFEIGIVIAVLGIIVLTHPFDVMNFIFIALGLSILFDSLFKIRIAFDSKKFGISSWWVIFSLSVVSAVIGTTLIVRPWDGAQALTVLLGVSLLFEGILSLNVAISTVKIVKNQYPDSIDADYYDKEDNSL